MAWGGTRCVFRAVRVEPQNAAKALGSLAQRTFPDSMDTRISHNEVTAPIVEP